MAISFETRFCLLLLFITFLHGGAIFFFTRGFLLTRTELSYFSHCDDALSAPCNKRSSSFGSQHTPTSCSSHTNHFRDPQVQEGKGGDSGAAGSDDEVECNEGQVMAAHSRIGGKVEGEESDWKLGNCWTEPAVKRVVILLIDALRFDFVVPIAESNPGRKPWMNKLKVLHELVDNDAHAAMYFKFISDPPTTTLQRLKGLTTGGLPTFIDVGHSFGAPAIVEDNLIMQLSRMGKRVVMMGDDTWLQLFPEDMAEVYPFPSFNVKDLHTVDNGVIKELFPALHRDNWDVLIAHFLGVDHVGHIFGVESPLMGEKLEQYNDVIENVISVLMELSKPGDPHEDTLLIVMGDHGQTLNGDHGGGTPEEVETALFAFSVRRPRGFLPQKLRSSTCNSLMDGSGSSCISTIPQLDFAPTLSALLGIPFPFGSVGRVNPELYALSAGTWSDAQPVGPLQHKNLMDLIKWLERYLNVLCINSWQVKRYFDAYEASSLSKFPSEKLSVLNDLYMESQLLANISSQSQCSGNRDTEYEDCLLARVSNITAEINTFSSFLTEAGLLARATWTQFGDVCMAVGVSILFVSLAVHGIAVQRLFSMKNSLKEDELVQLLPVRYGVSTFIFSGVTISILVTAFQLFSNSMHPFVRWIASVKDQMHLVLLGVLLCSSSWSYLSPIDQKHKNKSGHHGIFQWMLQSEVSNLRNFAAILFVVIHACSLLSNSFILSEGQVASFLLASLGILYLRDAIQESSKVLQAIFFLCLNRGLLLMGLLGEVKDATIQIPVTERIFKFSGIYAFLHEYAIFLSILTVTLLPLVLLSWVLIRHAFRKCKAKSDLLLLTAVGAPLAFILISIHWVAMDLSAVHFMNVGNSVYEFCRLLLPRMVYSISILLTLAIKILPWRSDTRKSKDCQEKVTENTAIAFLAAWSPTVILLMGRKGPVIALIAFLAGKLHVEKCYPWCTPVELY